MGNKKRKMQRSKSKEQSLNQSSKIFLKLWFLSLVLHFVPIRVFRVFQQWSNVAMKQYYF